MYVSNQVAFLVPSILFVWLFAGPAMMLPLSPFDTMVTTCRFEDNNLVIIGETIDKLIIQLKGVDRDDIMSKDESVRKSIQSLNQTYRGLVNRLTNVTGEENPLPVLKRLRRDIKDALDSAAVKEESAEATTDVATSSQPSDDMSQGGNYHLSEKWNRMVAVCLRQYKVLKRIIMFEHFLRGLNMETDQEDEELDQKDEQEPNWGQKAVCNVAHKLRNFGAKVQESADAVMENKPVLYLLILLGIFFVILVCIPSDQPQNHSAKLMQVK